MIPSVRFCWLLTVRELLLVVLNENSMTFDTARNFLFTLKLIGLFQEKNLLFKKLI